MPRRSQAFGQSRRVQIIQSAAGSFARHGYRQTTMEQISRDLNLSKGAVYVYFQNKEELYVSTLEFIFQKRYDSLCAILATDDPFPVKLRHIIGNLVQLIGNDDHYEYSRLSVESFLESDRIEALHAIKADSYHRNFELLSGFLRQGQAAGQLDAALDSTGAAVIMMAALDGMMLHSLVQGRQLPVDTIRSAAMQMLSRMLHLQEG